LKKEKYNNGYNTGGSSGYNGSSIPMQSKPPQPSGSGAPYGGGAMAASNNRYDRNVS